MDKEDIVVKKPRCKRGTRRNKKTGNCEKVKPRLTIVDVLPSPSTPVPSVNNTNRKLTSAEKTEILKEIFGSDEELEEDTPGELPDYEELKKITKEKIKNLSQEQDKRVSDEVDSAPKDTEIEDIRSMPVIQESVDKQAQSSINEKSEEQPVTIRRKKRLKKQLTLVEPGVAEPGVAEPGVAEPEIAEPEIAEPGVAEPEVAEEIDEELVGLNEYSYLYPSLDDPLFNKKISERQEFYDTRYIAQKGDVRLEGDKICNADFELASHQMFVRNFMSFQTPYNSLLLYHGLGSGKTCSGISVAEEMRDYMKQMGSPQRIMIIASPNVQENFKLQLFDERKLEEIDGLWNIRACTGNKYLKEINPMNMKGLSKERVVMQVKRIINTAYVFMGYIEFANYVEKKSSVTSDISESKREMLIKTKLRKHFGNRLIIIDEVHNIRMTEDNKDKRVAIELEKLVNNVPDLRLLFLSATPMYNSYKESIWLINLMNKNDGRSTIQVKDVFDSDGSFKLDSEGREIGKEILMRKARGYISFVRGDNPYTFPFRIWPNNFAPMKTFLNNEVPSKQLNGSPILQNLETIAVYLTNLGEEQELGYNMIIDSLKSGEFKQNMPAFENMESFGYTLLQRPLEALNIIYPIPNDGGKDLEIKELVGKGGLERIMSYKESVSPPKRYDFEYKKDVPEIFSPSEIGKYSGKIKSICDNIINSTGVILVYSQYIDGGIVPIALALEELGFVRGGSGNSLFKNKPNNKSNFTPPGGWIYGKEKWEELNSNLQNLFDRKEIDSSTPYNEILTKLVIKIPEGNGEKERLERDNLIQIAIRNATNQMKYVVISGDKALSPDNVVDLKAVTNLDNKNGDKVRVVLISQAGSEGLDFKFIRQVHVLEPWYNMNRIEQIIGRAVRTCSHKDLPFIERNVEIFLHGSLMSDKDEEAADIYVYRLAEVKAVQIGEVSRVLKEVAVDCILNSEQLGFTVEEMNQIVDQKLSTGEIIEYQVGDKPYTAMCDYMERCTYKCKPTASINPDEVKLDTYNESFIMMNTDKIMQLVRDLMKERYFYRKIDLIKELSAINNYSQIQIDAALTQLVEDENEYISDRYGRLGHLINIGDLYLFQPIEINNNNISTYDRSVPLEFKRENLSINLPSTYVIEDIKKPLVEEKSVNTTKVLSSQSIKPAKIKENVVIKSMKEKYDIATSPQILKRGEEDWYKFCSVAIDTMVESGIHRDILNQLVLEHIVDELIYNESLTVLNELYGSNPDSNTFEGNVLRYMTRDIMKAKGLSGILLDNMGSPQLLILKEEKEWVLAQPEDTLDLQDEVRKLGMKFSPLSSKINSLIGFMTHFKNEYIIFKTKDMNKKRTLGARCDQTTKVAAIKTLNEILEEEKYVTSTPTTKKELCVIQEFMLRLYNKNMKNGKIWFLSPIEATISNVEKVSF